MCLPLLILTSALSSPTIVAAEPRADGVLVTFDTEIDPTWGQASRWMCTGHLITDAIMAPDGHRVFLRTTGGPAGRHLVAIDDGPSTVFDAVGDAHRPGPDFAASKHPVVEKLDRTAPEGAIVLFGGHGTPNLRMRNGGPVQWKIIGDTLHVQRGTGDAVSTTPLGSGRYHVEWRSPAGGDPQKQDGGNSGVKIASRYEVQILNTEGHPRPARFNEAGSIYRIKAADRNVALGPDHWQVYDIWFTEPLWHDGEKIADARMTVWWNGVLVHDDVLVPNKTGASEAEGIEPRPLLLQDHHHAGEGDVCFRNVWFMPASRDDS